MAGARRVGSLFDSLTRDSQRNSVEIIRREISIHESAFSVRSHANAPTYQNSPSPQKILCKSRDYFFCFQRVEEAPPYQGQKRGDRATPTPLSRAPPITCIAWNSLKYHGTPLDFADRYLYCTIYKATVPKLPSNVTDPNPDPDPPHPHVFGPPGSESGSTSQRHGSGSSCKNS
jgi:hypothetical protein